MNPENYNFFRCITGEMACLKNDPIEEKVVKVRETTITNITEDKKYFMKIKD